jgi:putative ABC transport system permease protein
MILQQGVLTAAAGMALGLLGCFLLTRFLRSLLFEVGPGDSLTLSGVALLLIVGTGIASYIPARRATKVDPMVALRYE